jgi:hypothetical protein
MDDLTREQIVAAMRPKRQRFEVPELGGAIYLRGLTAGERDRFQASCWEGTGAERKTNLVDANARLVAMVWVDAAGTSLKYSDADLVQMDGALVGRLADLAVEMNALGAKAAETAKGNS